MKPILYIIILALFFSACSGNIKTEKNELVVFCAASLTDVISEIISAFEKESQVEVKLNLASTGTLARQIEHGANPAIFISANKEWVDYLNNLELTIPESEKKVAGNSMVLIAPLENPIDSFVCAKGVHFSEMFRGRLSVGDPQHVPAGNYAVQILENLGWKNELKSRLFPAKNVRSALMVVELGEAELGIVYKTDALKSEKVKIITEFPDTLHNSVSYYISMVKGFQNEKTKALYNYIISDSTNWEKNGFIH